MNPPNQNRLVAVVILGVALAASLLALVIIHPGQDSPTKSIGLFRGSDNSPSYPDEWEKSFGEVREQAAFFVTMPDHPDANREKLSGAFLRPDGAVILNFQPPEDAPTVRQDYIEIFMTEWEGEDPRVEFELSQKVDPIEGREVVDVDGYPAMIVHSNSKTDSEQANAAYLLTVIDGLEVEISGGDSLDRIVEIAKDVVAQLEKSPSAS